MKKNLAEVEDEDDFDANQRATATPGLAAKKADDEGSEESEYDDEYDSEDELEREDEATGPSSGEKDGEDLRKTKIRQEDYTKRRT